MAQVSYGTITITDTTDIENIFLIYKGSSSDSIAPSINWSSGGTTNDWVADITEVGEYDYIWAITVFKRTGIAITSSNFTDYYSDPICLTGEPGTSVSITSITYSTLTTQGQPADNTFTLSSPPSVPEGGYLWSRTLFSNGQSMYSKAKQGEKGDSVTGVRELYYLTTGNAPSKPTSSTTIYDYDIIAAWTSVVPEYIVNGKYYISLETTLSNNNKDFSNVVLDQGLTDANHNAYLSQSLAQSANENANGAMGQANNGIKEIYRVWYRTNTPTLQQSDWPTTHVTRADDVSGHWTKIKPSEDSDYCYYFYCEETVTNGGVSSWTDPVLDTSTLSKYEIDALDSKLKNFFWPGDENFPGAYAVGRNSTDASFDSTNANTYYHNVRLTPSSISIGYNKVPIIDLKTTPSPSSLDFYQYPTISGSTVTQGNLTMRLSGNALKFYNPISTTANDNNVQATLDANGLILKRGGLEAGTKNTTDYIYVWSYDDATNHNLSINNSGNKYDWRIIAGNKFGVDKAGNLYASNVNIEGAITATSFTISSGASVSGVVVPSQIADMATISQIPTTVASLSDASNYATKINAQEYANDASYLVEIEARSISYATSTATLFAHVYYKGTELTASTTPAISTVTFQWQKVVENSGVYSITNISGATSQSLTTSDLDTIYICVISKP